VIEVGELIDHIEGRIDLQALNDGLGSDANKLGVKYLELLSQRSEGLVSVLAQCDIDQDLAFC